VATAVSFSKTGTKHETTVKLDKVIFEADANHELVGQAYRTYLANGRSAGASTLKRGEVAGGGKKPWRQKGTGRARVGSIRVPNWKGGGIVFGPTGDENYTLNMPIKMKRTAIRQALSLQATSGQIAVIEAFTSTDGKVKPTVELLKKLKLKGSILLIVPEKNSMIVRATRNVEGLTVVNAQYLNVFTIMNADHLIFAGESLDIVKSWLGEK
jgi:large subunit ribosomal protein L4